MHKTLDLGLWFQNNPRLLTEELLQLYLLKLGQLLEREKTI